MPDHIDKKDGAVPVGAVMVVGAGIAGMQSAIDLANAGFKVYLVEALSAIGGKMAQLDKTFPTNDCSMCIVSPKLVEVGRHKNIEILTDTSLESLTGSVGHFQAKLDRRPRYIRLDRCTGCGECVARCPVEVPDLHNLGMSDRRAVYKRYAQAIPGAFAIDKKGVSPCRFGCPADVNAHAYVALIAQRRFAEALAVERRENPLPAVCGRICPHPCETECSRNQLDQPVAIAKLKRFLTDWEDRHPDQKPPLPEIDERSEQVAVIGGGPAGLTAARDLRLQGYQVTIFEAMPELGGMLKYGIPDYRLPSKTLQNEIQQSVLDLGVKTKCNTRIGKDLSFDELRAQGFGAFLLALGAHVGLKLKVPGESEIQAGLLDAAAFLRELNLGREVRLAGKVFVVGGGNVAMDAARSARRLGADEVSVIYRRAREQMPANPWEIEEAQEEGIKLLYLCNPVELLHTGGKLRAIKCVKMKLGDADASGRRRPIAVEGSEFELAADWLIPAISQKPDVSSLPEQLAPVVNEWGTLQVDEMTLQTEIADVFAAGDAVSGPATAIEAVHAGKQAAISIDRYFKQEDLSEGRDRPARVRADIEVANLPRRERVKMSALPAAERIQHFQEVELGYDEEQAVAEAGRCLDCATCCECYQCLPACQAEAIEHDQQAGILEVAVGSVILAPGFEAVPGQIRPEFGYEQYANVVTSLEFERLLSASGPSDGHVLRPSDGVAPRRVAWIQCVGSRDSSCGRDYCSSVCCMYATKEAVIAREHDDRIEATIFYIDLRAFGKGFDEYATRAQEHHGVRYLRSMVSRVIEDPVSGNLELRYVDEAGQRTNEEFDLVVLSVGLQVRQDTRELAGRLGVDLDPFGFARTSTTQPLASSRPGVFVCGVFNEPKDIPETVSEASGAAGVAAAELAAARGTLVRQEERPPERQIPASEALRIGVFVCHCGINIAAIVDVKDVAAYARELPGVVHADDFLYTCSQDTQEKMREIIKEHRLNRVVVASCSPRTHEPLFQDTLVQAGLNKYLFDMANIRDQCSWVHRQDKARATEKAKRLTRMSVANAACARPLQEREFEVNSNLLVIGGGLAGMIAAREAARQGFGVYLVEQQEQLGGNLRKLRRTYDGLVVADFLSQLQTELEALAGVRIFKSAQIVEHTGYIGNFETEIMIPPGVSRRIKHGATLVATGGQEARPELFGLGEDERVCTQTDFEQWLYDQPARLDGLGQVVMIQCAGSRQEDRPYCSRVCCNQAIKNALAYKARFPKSRVDILYRDIRSYGLNELSYLAARRQGINFIRYHPETHPLQVFKDSDGLGVSLLDPSIGQTVELRPQLLVLATGIDARENEELGTMLRVPRALNGFFIEAHAKLRPVDFATEGVFLAGLAHGPKNMAETITQASAAVARAATILSQPKLRMSGVVSEVNPEHCAVCLTCVRACPYHVPFINEQHTAEINPALCQGCGICVAECPAKTITLGHFDDRQLLAKVEALSSPARSRPKVAIKTVAQGEKQ